MPLPLARLAKPGETPSEWPTNWQSILAYAKLKRKYIPPKYIRKTEISMSRNAIAKRIRRTRMYLGMTKEQRKEHMAAWRKSYAENIAQLAKMEAEDETMRRNMDNQGR